MGLLSNRVDRCEIKAGDHIYTYRAVFTYSHHESGLLGLDCIRSKTKMSSSPLMLCSDSEYKDTSCTKHSPFSGIYVGGNKVVHFTRDNPNSSSNSSNETSEFPLSCPTYPDCGFKQPNSGVILSCLDCFLKKGNLYCFEYGVTPSVFIAKVRGGTCTIATSDAPNTVVHRAMYLLQNGFGNYDVFQNNCEDFTLYCKTGLLTIDRLGVGRSGQASSVIGAPLAALLSSPLKLLIPSPVGVATVTAGMYCMSRYSTDIGVRTDVVKVAVEDLAMKGKPAE